MAETELETVEEEQDPVEMSVSSDNWPSLNEDIDEDFCSSSRLVGSLRLSVITDRYYNMIGSWEMVRFVRDKSYRYNQNLLRVLNTRSDRLGYLIHPVGDVLSPFIDKNVVTIKGFVERAPGCSIIIPFFCEVHVFARTTEFESVKLAIKESGLILSESNSWATVIEEKCVQDEESINKIFKCLDSQVSSEGAVEALEPPRNMIKSVLYPHQKEGLGWLISRENSSKLPPLWEEKDGVYLNVLTNCQTWEKPKPIRGGIFADDRGLGKTLTLLSLAASDKQTYSEHPSGNVDVEINEEQVEENRKKSRGRGSRRVSKEKQKAEGLDANKIGEPPSSVDKPSDSLEPRSTLIVAPTSVSTWVTQIEEHTMPGCFKVYVYCGKQTKAADELQNFDIVLTTYSTLARKITGSPILNIEWRRVILDEAHVIMEANTNLSRVINRLKAECRWLVTGRPVQNNTYNLFSLMDFFKFEPFSIQNIWNSLIQHLLLNEDEKGMLRLQVLTASISLRRTKEKCLVGLPSKCIETYPVILQEEEFETYNLLEIVARHTARRYIFDDIMEENLAALLGILVILRQICTELALCPPGLRAILSPCQIEEVKNNPKLSEKLLLALEDEEVLDCPICLSPPRDIVITSCGHIFCRFCILKTIKRTKSCCPICRHPLSKSDLFISSEATSTRGSLSGSSSKVAALFELLHASRDVSPSAKSVIFSQFRKMLFLLEEPLRRAGFKFIRIDGSSSAERMEEMIKEFGIPAAEGPTIVLASLSYSVAAGINLTAASTVYLMEPSLNPAVEEVAIERVYQMGQKKDVKVVRFIATNTIDERILKLQERKKLLVQDASFKKLPQEDRKLISKEDLRILMDL